MSVSVEFVPGPLASEMSRVRAESALQNHPAIRKGAAYALEQLEGRWVAAVVHEAAPPFGGGAPADAEAEVAGPKSEGPDDAEPSEAPDSGGDESGESGESGPPSHKDEKGGEKGELHSLLEMIQAIADALGVPVPLGGSPMGPEDGSQPAPPPGPPGGHAGPPPAPAEQHVVHERVTKPGETPPGGTPLGAPAFASVREDHPWAHVAGKIASFEVAEKIGARALPQVEQELTALSKEIGYHWKNLREATDEDGDRVAVAVITRH